MTFYKQVELQKMFSIGSTYCSRICRAIDNHPEIYSEWSRTGTRYEICAFVHASKYLNELEAGDEVPAFNPHQIEEVLRAHDYQEEKKFTEHEIRLDLVDKVNDWFRVTQIPDNMSAKEFAKIARLGMISIVTE